MSDLEFADFCAICIFSGVEHLAHPCSQDALVNKVVVLKARERCAMTTKRR